MLIAQQTDLAVTSTSAEGSHPMRCALCTVVTVLLNYRLRVCLVGVRVRSRLVSLHSESVYFSYIRTRS